jgi:Cellulose binding domain
MATDSMLSPKGTRMNRSGPKRWMRKRNQLLAVILAAVALVLAQLPAHALEVTNVNTPVTGNATWFTNLGAPYGGCGLPQDALETQNFVALNVYNTPGDYNFYPRPLTGSDLSKIGMWNNGQNCGRWVRVSISDYCTGVNDGAQNQALCRNGSYVADKYNGATLDMLVADSCGDSNAWCRDDPYHLDLAKASLNTFVLNGAPVGDMDPDHWNNRHISWNFIPAPNYSGDIQVGFLQGAQTWWSAISVSHLANGIHGVEYFSNGAWSTATMDSDMGQAFIIKPLVDAGTSYQIRVRDVTDTLINGGRVYSFSLPASCGSQCSAPRTLTTYTTSGGSTSTPTPTPSSTPSPTASATPTATPTVTPTATSTVPSAGACTASLKTVGSWSGGFQGEVTVTAGSAAIQSWSVGWTLTSGQTVTSVWNGTSSVSGSAITVKNAAYNGSLAARQATTFGFLGTGSPSTPVLTCTAA